MTPSPHAVSWFEIPVTDFPRAKAFYEAVLGRSIATMEMGPLTMGMLSADPDPTVIGGAIVFAEGLVPSAQGTAVYLNGGEDLAAMLARVEPAGGSIAVPKTDIGSGFGYFAHFVDTEGNKVGLHSMR
jgi:predicted enzyme related to lactoylglutathione lyase